MIKKIFLLPFLLFSLSGIAQKPKHYSSSEIQMMLRKLDVLGTVLYVAAHPDDENTRLITYFANEKNYYTGYFSFTRGDGGQNLIGPEIRDQLGVIRTQELLAARRIDGGEQFFSRAVDFGYSKHPDETFNIWDKEQVLGDLVWVVRKFQPDVIVCRFNLQAGTTHGHHTASAMLGLEAFQLAGDKSAYSEQLRYVDPWQPKSIYWNTYWWRRDESINLDELVKYDIGSYNNLLGQSYSEIASESRSQHKSQGFGSTGARGEIMEYLKIVDGEEAKEEAFENINTSWSRVKGGKAIQSKIEDIQEKYDPGNPHEIVKDLVDLRNAIQKLDNNFWRKRKVEEVDELIYACLGLFLEGVADDYTATAGDSLYLNFESVNRSPVDVELLSLQVEQLKYKFPTDKELGNNIKYEEKIGLVVPDFLPISQPYWLKKEHSLGMFNVDDQQLIGQPENGDALQAVFEVKVFDEVIEYVKPIVFKENDPVDGEVYRPFYIIPPVSVEIEGDVWMFPNQKSRNVVVGVKAGKDSVSGEVSLDLPGGWKAKPSSYDYSIPQKGQQKFFEFTISPPNKADKAKAQALVTYDGKTYSKSQIEIAYDHIPNQVMFEDATSDFIRVELDKRGEKIGYVMGAGDAVPEALKQIGYEVDIINDHEFNEEFLSQYHAVILGVRALNTQERLKYDMPKLLNYVKNGGTLVIQYNTSHRLVTEDFAPYPLELSRDRVTVEEAPVVFSNPDHPILTYPNIITQEDFEGWVQERGLYFPGKWDDKYQTVISTQDPGSDPLKSAILSAEYGDGQFIYTSLSFFRELPAGVPGAYRLFTNIISQGK